MKYCHQCGSENPDMAKFCQKCGAELLTNTDAHNETIETQEQELTKELLLERISNCSSNEARVLIDKYITGSKFYQEFEEKYIKFNNRTVKVIKQTGWEMYIGRKIKEQRENLVDWFVYTNNLEHKIFLNKSILSLNLWITTIARCLGKSPAQFKQILTEL